MIKDEFLTLSEVAQKTGKSKATIRRWDQNGKLKAINYNVPQKRERLHF